MCVCVCVCVSVSVCECCCGGGLCNRIRILFPLAVKVAGLAKNLGGLSLICAGYTDHFFALL